MARRAMRRILAAIFRMDEATIGVVIQMHEGDGYIERGRGREPGLKHSRSFGTRAEKYAFCL